MKHLKTALLTALLASSALANATTNPQCMYTCEMQGQGFNSCVQQCQEVSPYNFAPPRFATPQCINQCMLTGRDLNTCRMECR